MNGGVLNPCLGAGSPTPDGSGRGCSRRAQLCPAPLTHCEHSLCSMWGGMQGTCQESCSALSTLGWLSSACAAGTKAGSRAAVPALCPTSWCTSCMHMGTTHLHLLLWWEQHRAGWPLPWCHMSWASLLHGPTCCNSLLLHRPAIALPCPVQFPAIASPCPLYFPAHCISQPTAFPSLFLQPGFSFLPTNKAFPHCYRTSLSPCHPCSSHTGHTSGSRWELAGQALSQQSPISPCPAEQCGSVLAACSPVLFLAAPLGSLRAAGWGEGSSVARPFAIEIFLLRTIQGQPL